MHDLPLDSPQELDFPLDYKSGSGFKKIVTLEVFGEDGEIADYVFDEYYLEFLAWITLRTITISIVEGSVTSQTRILKEQSYTDPIITSVNSFNFQGGILI